MRALGPRLTGIALGARKVLWACVLVWGLIFVAGWPLLLIAGQAGAYVLVAMSWLVAVVAPCALFVSFVCGIAGAMRHVLVDDAPRLDLLRCLRAVVLSVAGGLLAWWVYIFDLSIRLVAEALS